MSATINNIQSNRDADQNVDNIIPKIISEKSHNLFSDQNIGIKVKVERAVKHRLHPFL